MSYLIISCVLLRDVYFVNNKLVYKMKELFANGLYNTKRFPLTLTVQNTYTGSAILLPAADLLRDIPFCHKLIVECVF